MKVIAQKGLRVPMSGHGRKYITDSAAVDVPQTAYYVRRVLQGDLIEVDAATVSGADQGAAADAGDVASAKKTTKGA